MTHQPPFAPGTPRTMPVVPPAPASSTPGWWPYVFTWALATVGQLLFFFVWSRFESNATEPCTGVLCMSDRAGLVVLGVMSAAISLPSALVVGSIAVNLLNRVMPWWLAGVVAAVLSIVMGWVAFFFLAQSW